MELDSVACAAILELLEKNALLFMWLSHQVRSELDVSEIKDPAFLKLWKQSERFGLKARFYDLTVIDGIPAVLCLAETGEAQPYYSVGAACDLSFESAVRSALSECIQLFHSYSGVFSYLSSSWKTAGSYIRNYLERNTADGFACDYGFLKEAPLNKPVSETRAEPKEKRDLSKLLRILREKIRELYLIPLRLPDSTGTLVIKVISPQLFWSMVPDSLDLPMNRAFFRGFFENSRMYSVPGLLPFP
jgi:ribosomal protein S12 methylthiotransferase accessory factor YcaO